MTDPQLATLLFATPFLALSVLFLAGCVWAAPNEGRR